MNLLVDAEAMAEFFEAIDRAAWTQPAYLSGRMAATAKAFRRTLAEAEAEPMAGLWPTELKISTVTESLLAGVAEQSALSDKT